MNHNYSQPGQHIRSYYRRPNPNSQYVSVTPNPANLFFAQSYPNQAGINFTPSSTRLNLRTMASREGTVSEEEMANLQKLSSEYQPTIEGPPIGHRQSTQLITYEYAQADPVYVQKTTALSQRFTHYRTIKGDGNCGWRAIAFGYFEALIRIGDPAKFQMEEGRLTSLNELLNQAGFGEDLYSDWVEETILLIRECATSLGSDDGGAALAAKFNDPDVGAAIIQHFRMVTSAWMRKHADMYLPYLIDQTITEYCELQIEPHQVEIEHMGMNAVIDAIIKPAGIAVDVYYLDRSPGEEVNMFRFEPQTADGVPLFLDPPVIRLLYRPGHYDILYKTEDLINKYTVSRGNAQLAPQTDVVASMMSPRNMTPQVNPLSTYPALPHKQMSKQSYVYTSSHTNPGYSDPTYRISGYLETHFSPSAPISISYPNSPVPLLSPSTDSEQNILIRPSNYEMNLQADFKPCTVQTQVSCRTKPMTEGGEAHAHFANENFQPQIWKPDLEEKVSRKGGNAGNRSS